MNINELNALPEQNGKEMLQGIIIAEQLVNFLILINEDFSIALL
jgi:hypothetical protein